MSTPGTIIRRIAIVGVNNPGYQVSKDVWNEPLVIDSIAPDGYLVVRDRSQPDGWGLTVSLPPGVTIDLDTTQVSGQLALTHVGPVAPGTLVGRSNTLAGPAEPIVIGEGLALTGLTLNTTILPIDLTSDEVVGVLPLDKLPAHAYLHQAGGLDPLNVTTLAGFPGNTTKFLRADGTFATPSSGGSGGGGTTDLEYSGSYAPAVTYSDGDIVIGPDGIVYMCVKDGVTTPPEPWPGLGMTTTEGPPGPPGPPGPMGPPHTGTIGIVIDGAGLAITPGVKGFFEVGVPCTITGVTVLSTDAAVTTGSIVVDVWKAAYATYPPTAANSIAASARPTLTNAKKSQDTTLPGWTKTIAPGDILAFNVVSASTVTKVTLTLTVQIT